ncbi:conserved hypothetical protein [Ureaplasma parvum serovar 1 str. ATCC 27813]|uniref:hypothetical protein n=1 Tax=Ureaplasma parvum TaxID=134821 RepID=UPI000172216A|nr:hypothetical protein [Ureaplasma parvum]ASD24608.1 hypothetical protein CEG38_01665 [Ureaplasma parvum]EDT48866.1 conserved hypothetical protein [Ureaplasma parvum serovar 1 str. ATCC 27813]
MSKKINNDKTPRNKVKNNNVSKDNDDIVISLRYENWVKGERVNSLTTYTKDKNQFLKNIIYILNTLFPYVYKNWKNKGINDHCHPIKQNDEKSRNVFSKYIKLIKKLHPNLLKNDNEELELYQLGLGRSVRVICSKIDNILFPLLIDHHHLGYESQSYNDKDTKKYDYCPLRKYNKNQDN